VSVEIDICNSALIKLGAEPINSLDDDLKEARLCRIQYPKIRDSVLRSAPWNFAVKRALLTPVVETLEFGEADDNIFLLPNNCVRVWKLNDGDPQQKYKIEGNKIICALPELQLFYVANDVPVSYYDANFKEAVACMLAADLCYSLTQSAALKQGLEGSGEFWINQARSHNSQESTPDDFMFDDFLMARQGGRAFYP
jgi:hypothetical protein